MELYERVSAFARLGDKISHLANNSIEEFAYKAAQKNSWFTSASVKLALDGIACLLSQEKLSTWVRSYPLHPSHPKKIGIVMAGNIPLVGFHDFLCVLMSGHRCAIKLSSQDDQLLPELAGWLLEIEPRFKNQFNFVERLNHTDAIIATGSDNTARYFEYYFRKIPHLIRKNRTSCAILIGEESDQQLFELGKDVFSYFGLGCRNVSKIFVPEDFDFDRLLRSWDPFREIIHHHKYANNYDYQKAILLINKSIFFDSGFVLIAQNSSLVSPVSVLFYETYRTQDELKTKIESQRDKIQCMVSAQGWFAGSIPLGKAQLPDLTDYADGIDTMKFLSEIGN